MTLLELQKILGARIKVSMDETLTDEKKAIRNKHITNNFIFGETNDKQC